MKIFTSDEWDRNYNYKNLSFHHSDCPTVHKRNSLGDNIVFGLKDYFLTHPDNSEVLIEFTLDELKELRDTFDRSYHTLKNYLENGEE